MTSAPKKPVAKAGNAPAARRPQAVAASTAPTAPAARLSAALLPELRQLIEASRHAAAVTVNMAQTQLYWRVGQRIRAEVLGEQRVRYGEQIVATLWRQFRRRLLAPSRPTILSAPPEACA